MKTPEDLAYRWRTHNAGRVLNSALRRFEQRVMELMAAAGHTEARGWHVNLTRHLDLDGTRITELARRSAMTNAAMNELVGQCEALGLVERVPDPTDKRARIVRFTREGLAWLEDFGRAVEVAQQEMAKEVGERALSLLLKNLAAYAAAAD